MSVVFVEFSVCVFRLTWCYNSVGAIQPEFKMQHNVELHCFQVFKLFGVIDQAQFF